MRCCCKARKSELVCLKGKRTSAVKKTRHPLLDAGFCYCMIRGENMFVVPAPGLELGTYRLQGGCSTN